jgi:hypothetical protein
MFASSKTTVSRTSAARFIGPKCYLVRASTPRVGFSTSARIKRHQYRHRINPEANNR